MSNIGRVHVYYYDTSLFSMTTFALLGFGPMAQALTLQAIEKGHTIHLWNRTYEKLEQFSKEHPSPQVHTHHTVEELLSALPAPRTICLLLQAGTATHDVVEKILPLLTPGDSIIDLGNNFYKETEQHQYAAKQKGIAYFASGISGGIPGARQGAAFMVSGPEENYGALSPLLTSLAATKANHTSAAHYLGENGEGHAIKMIHNGIEYGHMDIWRSVYSLLKTGLSWQDEEIIKLFEEWNNGQLQSFLLSTIINVLHTNPKDPWHQNNLLPHVEHKGTTQWMCELALQHHIPIPAIYRALEVRLLSEEATSIVPPQATIPTIEKLLSALPEIIETMLTIITIEGLQVASAICPKLSSKDILESWSTGCIISGKPLDHLLLQIQQTSITHIVSELRNQPDIREHLSTLLQLLLMQNFPLGSIAGIYEAVIIPTHPEGMTLLASVRDAFGAHGISKKDGTTIHGPWTSPFLNH